MSHRVLKMFGLAFAVIVVPATAFAFPNPVPVPEPATLTLLASGVGGSAGIYAIRRWLRRK